MHQRARLRKAAELTAIVLFVLATWGLFLALVLYRAELEPAVRLFHNYFPARIGRYEPSDYLFYEIALGVYGTLPLVLWAYVAATRSAVNRKVDAYLASRLPRHELIVHSRPSAVDDGAPAGSDVNDRS